MKQSLYEMVIIINFVPLIKQTKINKLINIIANFQYFCNYKPLIKYIYK